MEETKSRPSDVSAEDEKGSCDHKEFVSSEAIDDSIETTRYW